jgi:hypothetical protein
MSFGGCFHLPVLRCSCVALGLQKARALPVALRLLFLALASTMHDPFWGRPTAIGDSREINYEHSPYVLLAPAFVSA